MTENELPVGWSKCQLSDIVLEVNKLDKLADPESLIEYIDISSIDNERNVINQTKSFVLKNAPSRAKQIIKSGDVLFSLVRPYLRNIASVPHGLNNQIASTGFCVLRPSQAVVGRFLFFIVTSRDFVNAVSGKQYGVSYPAVKEKQVTEQDVWLPPLNEQKRIVAKIEELFSELDNGIAALKTAREKLKLYRQAVLKHAFEGKLTAQWREENKDKLETPEQLLARIQKEREARYQQQLEEWKAAVKVWEEKGKEGKKPSKPSKPAKIIQATDEDLPPLPTGWAWVEYAGICEQIRNGISAKPNDDSGSKIFRISAVRAMEFNLDDVRYLQDPDGQYRDYYLSKGDLVFTRYNGTRNYVGVCAVYKGDGTHLYPDKLIQTRVAVASISPSYLEKAINGGGSRKFMEKRIRTTAGQSGISGRDIKQMPVPICCKDEQILIEQYLNRQISNINAINDEINIGIRKAETLRQSILKKAFSGQLVPQDPNDEPASELLARIQAEKAAQQAAAKGKKRQSNGAGRPRWHPDGYTRG